MTISAIIYARASAECAASAEEQGKLLEAFADGQGWTVTRILTDRPMPTKRGRQQRPGEAALLAAIRAGAVDKVLLFSLDRVGRSLPELVTFLETSRAANVDIYIHGQIDSASYHGLSLFDLAKMFSHHLSQSRRDRILRGQAAARNADIRFGRPPIASAKAEKAKAFLAKGKGVRETARLVGGISPASVHRIKASMDLNVRVEVTPRFDAGTNGR